MAAKGMGHQAATRDLVKRLEDENRACGGCLGGATSVAAGTVDAPFLLWAMVPMGAVVAFGLYAILGR